MVTNINYEMISLDYLLLYNQFFNIYNDYNDILNNIFNNRGKEHNCFLCKIKKSIRNICKFLSA